MSKAAAFVRPGSRTRVTVRNGSSAGAAAMMPRKTTRRIASPGRWNPLQWGRGDDAAEDPHDFQGLVGVHYTLPAEDERQDRAEIFD
jgi:hypothetical protein